MSIKIENTRVSNWETAIRDTRKLMNSLEESDSAFFGGEVIKWAEWYKKKKAWAEEPFPKPYHDDENGGCRIGDVLIGPNDHKFLMNLCKGGTEKAKWRCMVHVKMDVTAPLYWWEEFETYKVGTVSFLDSENADEDCWMHKIHAKEFTLDDFSCEHLVDCPDSGECEPYTVSYDCEGNDEYFYPMDSMRMTVSMLNAARKSYLRAKAEKKYWWQMIQLLPSSYNQKRTIDLNYEVLASQYRQRKDHKLDEWREYCDWIRSLPYSEFITMEETK